GNLDHILVGPGGLFTIETKSHRGRFSIDHIDPAMLRQAYAQKKLLERIPAWKPSHCWSSARPGSSARCRLGEKA
ncbi:MAG TPA: nuclease-related domain-containing protein, partial [Gemmatimonadaceae bacterium]|nr:nuclease-related domain-containing protein [Gemmatimonadaceae bacterium]